MRVINRHSIGPGPVTQLTLPVGAKVVYVDWEEHAGPVLYIEMDIAFAELEQREFLITQSGTPMPRNAGDHLGSFKMGFGLIGHVYTVDPDR